VVLARELKVSGSITNREKRNDQVMKGDKIRDEEQKGGSIVRNTNGVCTQNPFG